MKKFCPIVAALALFAASVSTALAGGPGCGCCTHECPPKPSPAKVYLEVKFKPTTMEVTEEKLVCREVVNYVKCVEMVPVWTEKQRTVTTYAKVAREIEKEVVSCKMVPECVCDPCTGCTKTCYKPQVCVQKVKCFVWDCVPTTQVVTEKVCCMQPQEKVVAKKCIVQELVEETKKEEVTVISFDVYKGHLPTPPAPTPLPCAPAAPCCGH